MSTLKSTKWKTLNINEEHLSRNTSLSITCGNDTKINNIFVSNKNFNIDCFLTWSLAQETGKVIITEAIKLTSN